jgi:hypothetical protein
MKNSINLNFGLHHLHTVFTGILWFTVQDPVPVVAGLAEVAALVPLLLEPTFSALLGVRVMVFHVTFNKIAIISWRSVLWVEETEILGENHRSVASLANFIT